MESISADKTANGVLISWTTVSEINTFGFRVLRQESDSREKTARVVSPIIPAAGNGVNGATYQFLDQARRATPGAQYFVEDIDIYGRVTRHGPLDVQGGMRKRASSRAVKHR